MATRGLLRYLFFDPGVAEVKREALAVASDLATERGALNHYDGILSLYLFAIHPSSPIGRSDRWYTNCLKVYPALETGSPERLFRKKVYEGLMVSYYSLVLYGGS